MDPKHAGDMPDQGRRICRLSAVYLSACVKCVSLFAGVTVGTKAIVRLPGLVTRSNASAVRFTCKSAIGVNDAAFGATLSAFSLHTLVDPPAPPPKMVALRSYWGAKENDTAPCATRDGGTCGTFTAAQYTLVRDEALVFDSRDPLVGPPCHLSLRGDDHPIYIRDTLG